jgi:hypothetical protein
VNAAVDGVSFEQLAELGVVRQLAANPADIAPEGFGISVAERAPVLGNNGIATLNSLLHELEAHVPHRSSDQDCHRASRAEGAA